MAKSMTTIKAVFSQLRPRSRMFSQLRPTRFYDRSRTISENMQEHLKANKEIYDDLDRIAREMREDAEKRAAEHCSRLCDLIAQMQAFKRDATICLTVTFLTFAGFNLAAVYRAKVHNHHSEQMDSD